MALVAAMLLLPASPSTAAGRCGAHPWCDTSLTPERRAALLLAALTPDERIGLLAGDGAGGPFGSGAHTGSSDGVARLGLPPLQLTDGALGVVQGSATALPSSMALAASFDRRLARAHGGVVGNEARLKGNDVVYAPTVNTLRTPLWGRAFESFGEDPYLIARMGVGWIRAAQAEGVIASVKHFAANNQEGQTQADGTVAGSRARVDARVDERTLNELYLPQFEAAVREAGAGAVMCSYNRVNGAHACESRQLLDRILRRRWGFRGFVLADYGASKRIGTGLRAGLDFEPFPTFPVNGGDTYSPAAVRAALASGTAGMALVDRAVGRLLRTLFAHGFFDRAGFVDDDSRIDRSAHLSTARRLAERGTTLLKNDGALPLGRLRSLAVIGAEADAYKSGYGSSTVHPYSYVTPRDGIARRAGAGVEVRYDPGHVPMRAAAAARGADAAVVVVADTAGEGEDKPCLALDCGSRLQLRRDELIEAVAAVNPRTIVVLETAGPVLTPWRSRVEAIVEAWYPGSAGGTAIARVLFGDVDPGGRLPATFPRSAADLPTAGDPRRYPGVKDVVRYSGRVLVGYRWFDQRGIRPAFPFGFGLSYTSFGFRGLRVRPDRRGVGARVSIEIVNTGDRTGVAVPQLYLGLPGARGRRQPPRQLKGFDAVRLRAGGRARVRFRLDRRAFAHWSARRHRWAVARGCYRVLVGASSRDILERATVPVGRAGCRG
jgi:beta-glucosidase